MEDILKDKRFAHVARDPKFRRMPKYERKVKIDKRFQSMFTDKKFNIKYTVDKRGRPINQTSVENLRKYYDLSSEEESSSEESDSAVENEQSKKNFKNSEKKKSKLKSNEDESSKEESDLANEDDESIQKSKKNLKKSQKKKDKTKSNEEELNVQSNSVTKDKQFENQKSKKSAEKSKMKKNKIESKESKKSESNEESENDDNNFSSNGSLLMIKNLNTDTDSDEKTDDDDDDEDEILENEKQLQLRGKDEKVLDTNVKKKLRDLTVDYARGEGVLMSDSSSDEESSEDEDDEEEIEHNWGELDKEAETTEEATYRLAACNMDWDRIRAVDLMVLFNSFLPTGGLIKNVAIYPSDYGLQRMKEEEVKGPIELVESKSKDDEDEEITDDENEEGSNYHMEKLRQYQLNRLKYFYAVIVFDSATTANKVYTECDGLEYESSSTKLDLRFIPDDMSFDQEPRETCDKLPDLTKYKPRLFTTTALQQVKVDLTWDETDPHRQEITQKLNSGNLDEIDKSDIQAYLASGSSENESEDEVKKQLDKIDDSNTDENPIDKYKSLLQSIEEAEEKKKNNEVGLEFTWGLGIKEKTEKMVKEKMKQNENLTPFEQYLEKRKAKKKAKREQKKNLSNDGNKSDSEDSIPSDIDMNDPYFAEEFKNSQPKSQKRKKQSQDSDIDSAEEEQEKKRQAELELLLMDENEESNKHHFSMKRIEEAESLTKSKKKRLSKKKKDLKEEASKDNFEVNVQDSRFNALFTSHHYNIDPADPHYRKTKGTEALVQEKLKRRNKNDNVEDVKQESNDKEKGNANPKGNAELNNLIKSIKRNTQNLSKRIK